jgi:tRNA-splicing ligase RtcB
LNIVEGIPVWGKPDPGALSQIKTCAFTADKVALMADHHKGYAVPIGGVVAYKSSISPSGVGFDIACGNKAVLTDMPGEALRTDIKRIMDDVWKNVAFGIGRHNVESVDHALFESPSWKLEAVKDLKKMASDQLGTVGSGNHYVDLFTDEQDRVWIGVHFGSRGLGHKTATWFLNKANAKDGMDVEPCVIPVEGSLGTEYLECMNLAGQYAYAGRDWVCQKVAGLLGAKILEEVHNHHNFAWRETHGGQELWVVRKGATPAFPGQRGFVGGTMGEQSVILEGVENDEARFSLYSTVHGAGRLMGRREAAGKSRMEARWVCQDYRKCSYSAPKGDYHKDENGPTPKCPQCGHKLRLDRRLVQLSEGRVTKTMMEGWLQKAHVELRGAGLDESPDCYKRLPEVLAEHSSSIKILHTLTPVGVAMAGADIYDPFKD